MEVLRSLGSGDAARNLRASIDTIYEYSRSFLGTNSKPEVPSGRLALNSRFTATAPRQPVQPCSYSTRSLPPPSADLGTLGSAQSISWLTTPPSLFDLATEQLESEDELAPHYWMEPKKGRRSFVDRIVSDPVVVSSNFASTIQPRQIDCSAATAPPSVAKSMTTGWRSVCKVLPTYPGSGRPNVRTSLPGRIPYSLQHIQQAFLRLWIHRLSARSTPVPSTAYHNSPHAPPFPRIQTFSGARIRIPDHVPDPRTITLPGLGTRVPLPIGAKKRLSPAEARARARKKGAPRLVSRAQLRARVVASSDQSRLPGVTFEWIPPTLPSFLLRSPKRNEPPTSSGSSGSSIDWLTTLAYLVSSNSRYSASTYPVYPPTPFLVPTRTTFTPLVLHSPLMHPDPAPAASTIPTYTAPHLVD